MDKHYCGNCVYYCQHYSLDKRKIYRLFCGHCKRHVGRRKLPDTVACEHFSFASADEDAFATKEYLSKELLQYLLHLELLPPIETAAE